MLGDDDRGGDKLVDLGGELGETGDPAGGATMMPRSSISAAA
jgi:hypothetical protein